MSFDVNMMSDEQLDELLEKPKKIPTWRVVNTQTAREKKRIRQLELHNKQLEAARLYQKKRQRARLLAAKRKEELQQQKQWQQRMYKYQVNNNYHHYLLFQKHFPKF